MTTLSAEPYKGTRDFYPSDMRLRNYVFSTWRRVVQRYGYEAYDAPLIEPVDVYAAKSGKELVSEQTYQFVDRGDRHVAIRPELTPSVSRMIARRRQEVAYPARWYNIGQCMRYERPQKGREREFWQLNVDIFGANGVGAEAEIIAISDEILREFGAKRSMYSIRINNRKLINYMMGHYLGLDAVQAQLMIKLFDRKDKISHEAFRDQAAEIFGEVAPEGMKKIAALLSARSMAELPEQIRDSQAVDEVQQLFTQLEALGIKNSRFDISLMRGFDYYTGMVFEFFDTHPENNRSLYGGGRYDGLVGLFGAEPVSAVGVAPGYTMIEEFLKTHELVPNLTSMTDLYLITLPGAEAGAQELAHEFRAEGLNVELDMSGRKADKQLKTAVKKSIPYIIFVGENELKSRLFTLKSTLNSTADEELSFERVVSTVHDRRRQLGQGDDLDFAID